MNGQKLTDHIREKHRILHRFLANDALTSIKLLEYLPSMIINNLSGLLLITVDGLVVGNLVGKDALAAVNIFQPATVVIGAVSVLIAVGSATSLSVSIGENDLESIRHVKAAVVVVMIFSALAVAVLQVPVVYMIIQSYNLPPDMLSMTWRYAVGIMISMPLGLISTVGVHQLQILGKMKILTKLSIMEGLLNLVLDLLLVGVFHMGVAGAGYGTACANLARCTATLIYLWKKTDIYRSGGVRAKYKDIINVLTPGVPEAANSGLNAVQNHLMMMILLSSFGPDGAVIKGVCAFCYSLMRVFFSGVIGSMRPLLGLMTGARDLHSIKKLMLQCFALSISFAICMVALVILLPGWFYHIHGVREIPDRGLMSLRFYSLFFLLLGIDMILRTYFVNRGAARLATRITVAYHILLPVFASLLNLFLPAPFIMLSYLITEIMVFWISFSSYRKQMKKDEAEMEPDDGILYLTVSPGDAVEASEMIMDYANEIGCPPALSYKVALCMEEMVAYAVKEQKGSDIRHPAGDIVRETGKPDANTIRIRDMVRRRLIHDSEADPDKIQVHIVVRLEEDGAEFLMIDNGKRLELDENKESQEAVADNYEFLKRIAKSVTHQYVLDLNYTVVKF